MDPIDPACRPPQDWPRLLAWSAAPLDAASSWCRVATPLGPVLLVADEDALTGLHFEGTRHVPAIGARWVERPAHPVLAAARAQLAEYCQGRRLAFALPLRLHGTPFQQAIWRGIAAIPAGRRTSYRALAAGAGNPAAARAAGAATGRNPVSIVVPCHRVMGSDGAITGYSGGLDRKRALLEFEAAVLAGRRATLASFARASQGALDW